MYYNLDDNDVDDEWPSPEVKRKHKRRLHANGRQSKVHNVEIQTLGVADGGIEGVSEDLQQVGVVLGGGGSQYSKRAHLSN